MGVTYQGTCDSTGHGPSLLGYFVLWIPAEPTSLATHLPAGMFRHPAQEGNGVTTSTQCSLYSKVFCGQGSQITPLAVLFETG